MTADGIIRLGFWMQVLLLGLVDWATIHAFLTQEVPWYHYAGFVVVNAVLLWLTYIMWGWLRQQKTSNAD